MKHPKRAYIALVDVEEEGEEMWTPIGRLKCRWEDVDRFNEVEAKWVAIAAASGHASDVEAEVVELVFGCFDEAGSLNYWVGNHHGVTAVENPASFQVRHSIPLEEFLGSLCFEDNGAIIISLQDTLELARRLAVSDPEKIQYALDVELGKASEEHLEDVSFGKVGKKRWTWNGTSTRPRIDDLTEAAAIIRGWIGASQVQDWDELLALRAEVARLSSIISKASGVLHAHGLIRDTASIRRLHGPTRFPVPRLKSYFEMSKEMNEGLKAHSNVENAED
ncbi:hypothetical protein QEH68_01350 [Paenarthrobacter sp. OM7]|uniref:hypothetical protein n=1 Tax=Paenarthrobacter sp. OM7 TaxID=3041264 RepID=UPI002469188E|nr:hypothetical protein [Paenarthrobacter sp. OM7]WGM20864.1 hypothetical protein QEH68_01350 [Paenarthrobacter sp. OM7]